VRAISQAELRFSAGPLACIMTGDKELTLVPTMSRRISLLGIVWVQDAGQSKSQVGANAPEKQEDHRGGCTHKHATAPRPARRSEDPLARVAVFAAGEYSPSSLLARLRFAIGLLDVRRLTERRRRLLLTAAAPT
jgi:hypothetical protein